MRWRITHICDPSNRDPSTRLTEDDKAKVSVVIGMSLRQNEAAAQLGEQMLCSLCLDWLLLAGPFLLLM